MLENTRLFFGPRHSKLCVIYNQGSKRDPVRGAEREIVEFKAIHEPVHRRSCIEPRLAKPRARPNAWLCSVPPCRSHGLYGRIHGPKIGCPQFWMSVYGHIEVFFASHDTHLPPELRFAASRPMKRCGSSYIRIGRTCSSMGTILAFQALLSQKNG